MPTAKKFEAVKELQEKLSKSKVTILTDYRGLKVNQTEELRNKLAEANAEYHVTKNTLLEKAVKETNVKNLPEDMLKGPTAALFAYGDEVSPVKILVNFIKNVDVLKLKTAIMGNQVLSVNEINTLAKLPSKDILIAQLVGGLSAPMSGLANVLQGNIKGLVYTLNAIVDKKS